MALRVLRIGVISLVVLTGALPLLSTWMAGVVASAAGCRLHEGGANECLVAGHDLGGPLYLAGTSFWITVVSVPLLAPLVGVWLLCEAVVYAVRNWRVKVADLTSDASREVSDEDSSRTE